MSLTDKDAQRRLWCMFGDGVYGPSRLIHVDETDALPYVSESLRIYKVCRECTPEELALHGLTQPPQPWADRVRQWAIDRNIIGGTTPKDQFGKLVEEVGELSTALQKNDMRLLADSIGDVSVVLAIIAAQKKLDYELCQEGAWQEIKDRKGRIENGVFVKEVSE